MTWHADLTHTDRAERQRRVAKRYDESGLPAEFVAREFGLSRGHVSYIARLYGVNRPVGKRARREAVA